MDRDPAPGAQPATSPPQRGKRRLLRWLAIGVIALLALALAAPHVLNLGFVRRQLADQLSDQLHARVELGDLGFGWFSGLTVGELTIHNPPGFAQDHPFLAMRSLRGDLSLTQLLRGRLDLSGRIEGLVVPPAQDAQGRSNAEAIAHARTHSGQPPSADTGDVRLDLTLADALVEVRRGGELLESLQLQGSLAKDFGSQ